MARPQSLTAVVCTCVLLAAALPARGPAASAGFVLRRSAIASVGGFATSGHNLVLGLTSAQSVTGVASRGSALHESAGFWTGARWGYVVGVGDPSPGSAAARFSLEPVAPNPAPGAAVLRFAVPASGGAGAAVNLAVYDVAGRMVRTLLAGPQDPGEHSITWNGTNTGGARVGSGIYFVALSAPSVHLVRRLVLLR